MRLVRGVTLVLLAILAMVTVALSSACGGGGDNTASFPATETAASTSNRAEVVKPSPVILGISATTSGMFGSYYAILDVTVKNEGADGMIILIGSINQDNHNVTSELPIYLAHKLTQTVRMILPLTWRGGDWTPSAVAEIP